MLVQTVEVGFDLAAGVGPFLTLDDPVAGKLDDPEWVLAGSIFFDLTDDVQSVTISRGKTADFDSFPSGEAVVVLDNRSRTYDPTYTSSPFYGQIIPKRNVKISTNGIIQYYGVIDDWNLDFSVEGEATATFVASDGIVYLNNQTLPAGTATVQYSGARVNTILSDPNVNWPLDSRNVDVGNHQLGADVIADNTNVLTYLQLVETSEGGRLFVAKNGDLTFKDQTVTPSATSLVELSDNGIGIPYQNMTVVYGSEKLYNEVVLSSVITTTELTARDESSIGEYGIFNLTLSDLLIKNDIDMENYARILVQQYSSPEFRFDSIEVRLNDLNPAQQASLLNLEIGDVVKITFTPSNVPPAIVKYAEIIRQDHEIDTNGEHLINFGFSTVDYVGWLLGTEAFGRLDFITTI